MKDIIYLDNNATTPMDPRVLEAMLPYFCVEYANAASNHAFGVSVNKAVKHAREQVANLIGSDPHEIIFTSGATEAINLAIKGFASANKSKGNHIITVQTEHKAVLDVCHFLEKYGFEITYLPVQSDGIIDLEIFKKSLKKETILVSIMYVNNETGVMQPINEVGEICKNKDVLFFTDASQAVGKIKIDVNEINADLMCFSGHKFYGPKGVGGLYRRNNVIIEPLFHGGGHERGLRSGTLNVPGIVGLAKAFEIAHSDMSQIQEKVKNLRNKFENELLKTKMVKINGHPTNRLFNVSNIYLTKTDPFLAQNELGNVAYSQGSACNSSSVKPSHVLKAMGLSDKDALSSFRFSFGRDNNMNDINLVIRSFKKLFEAKTELY